jgi:intein/homing endonuclease
VDLELAWLFGFFAADGTSGKRIAKTKIGNDSDKYAWELVNNNITVLEKAQKILYTYGYTTNICEYDNRGVVAYKLISSYETKKTSNVRGLYYWFEQAHSLREHEKIVPSFILNASVKAQKAYLDGYLEGDGHFPKDRNFFTFGSIDFSLLDGLCKILSRLGIDYYLRYRDGDGKQNPWICVTTRSDKKVKDWKPTEILHIDTYEMDDYVFDLETENHHFCGGIGSILLHNTEAMFHPFLSGGALTHMYLGDVGKIEPVAVWRLIQHIARNTLSSYFAFTRDLMMCDDCGYMGVPTSLTLELKGVCPNCGGFGEIYSRITGYLQALNTWNAAKKQEFLDRKRYKLNEM